MRSLSQALTAVKNSPNLREPYLILFELEKAGWWRLNYRDMTAPFSQEATVTCGDSMARILFVEQVSQTTGYLIVDNVGGTGIFEEGDALVDSEGGEATLSESVDTTIEEGMTFRFARNLEAVFWNGETYEPFPFAIDAIHASKEKLPTVTLQIANAMRLPEAWLRRANGFLGERARLIVVYSGSG